MQNLQKPIDSFEYLKRRNNTHSIFPQNLFCETIPGENEHKQSLYCNKHQYQLQVDYNRIKDIEVFFGRKAPQVYNVVLVVPPVQMHIIGIDQQEAKKDEQDLYGAFSAIHKVSVEDVRLLRGRKTVLSRHQLMC